MWSGDPAAAALAAATIDQAVGVVMVRLGVDAYQAAIVLRQWALEQGLDLVGICESVLRSVPSPGGRDPQEPDRPVIDNGTGLVGGDVLDGLAEAMITAGEPRQRAQVVFEIITELYVVVQALHEAQLTETTGTGGTGAGYTGNVDPAELAGLGIVHAQARQHLQEMNPPRLPPAVDGQR